MATWDPPPSVSTITTITSAWGNMVRAALFVLRGTPEARCVAYHNTTQAITAGNTTALAMNAEDVDTASMHDLVTNNSRITIPSGGDGFYVIHGISSLVNNNNGTGSLHLRKNGSTIRTDSHQTSDTDFEDQSLQVFAGLALVGGDYLELFGQAATNTFTFGSATRALATTLTVIGPLPPS
jgi:hypothetical protein